MTKETLVKIWFVFVHLAVIIGLIIAVIALCTGCSHNSVQYSDGVGFETTFRPDSGNFGITFRYGKILSVAARENTEVEMTGEGQGSGGENSGGASSSGSVKVKIGKQITGYYVDALNAGATPEQLNTYLNGENTAVEAQKAADPYKDTPATENAVKTP